MNLLLLTIAFRAWSGSALSAFLRVFAAIAIFSLEIQAATWLHTGTISSMRLLNLVVALVAVTWRGRRARVLSGASGAVPPDRPESIRSAYVSVPPVGAIAVLAALVALLAFSLPVTGADPYHLHRVDQITRLGTLAYDPSALDIKINALAGVYELLLADMRVPGMATALVRLHGLFGLGLYLLAIAAVAPWLTVTRRWPLIALLVVPVVFHQLVLVKNDLFGAIPAFVALVWVVTRGPAMSVGEVAAAATLAGFAAGIKISSAPVVVVVMMFALLDHRGRRSIASVCVAGILAGAVAGGLSFTLLANASAYGGALQPYLSLGNRFDRADDSLVGVGRFALSLVDMGTLTPRLWPGRGGWGSTFGLPLIWALAVLAINWRDRTARRALMAAGTCFVIFAATYPDADVAHRIVIAPGLVLIAVAASCADRSGPYARWIGRALVLVLVLSGVEIARSAMLYLTAR